MQSLSNSRLSEPSTWAGFGGLGTLLMLLNFIAENGTDGVALAAKLIPFVTSGDYLGAGMAALGFILAIIKREKKPAASSLYVVGNDGA